MEPNQPINNCPLCSIDNIKDLKKHILTEHDEIFRENKSGKGDKSSDYPGSNNPDQNHLAFNNPVLENQDECKDEFLPIEERVQKKKEETVHLKVEKIVLVIIKGIQCSKCPFRATDPSLLNDHITKKHLKKIEVSENQNKTGKTICRICKEAVTTFYLERHQQTVHNPRAKPLPCTICEKSFFDLWSRKKHFQELHGGKYFCQTCQKQFGSPSDLKKHLNRIHSPKPILLSCTYCGQAFNDLYSRKKHYEEVHGDKRLKCSVCKKSFSTSYNMEKHRQNIHSRKAKTCTLCKMTFVDLYSRRRHFKEFHRKQSCQTCPTCGKSFKRSYRLKEHFQKYHSPEKRLKNN